MFVLRSVVLLGVLAEAWAHQYLSPLPGDACFASLYTEANGAGPGAGSRCLMSFQDNGESHNRCTLRGHDKMWCRTAWGAQGDWGECKLMTKAGVACVGDYSANPYGWCYPSAWGDWCWTDSAQDEWGRCCQKGVMS